MVDWVPIASVAATAAVGIAGNVTQLLVARGSQQHERRLAEDARRDQNRREQAQLREAVAAWAHTVRNWSKNPGRISPYRGAQLEAQLIAHASPDVRAAVRAVDAATSAPLDDRSLDLFSLTPLREAKEAAIDAQDFATAAERRIEERAVLEAFWRYRPPIEVALDELERVLSA